MHHAPGSPFASCLIVRVPASQTRLPPYLSRAALQLVPSQHADRRRTAGSLPVSLTAFDACIRWLWQIRVMPVRPAARIQRPLPEQHACGNVHTEHTPCRCHGAVIHATVKIIHDAHNDVTVTDGTSMANSMASQTLGHSSEPGSGAQQHMKKNKMIMCFIEVVDRRVRENTAASVDALIGGNLRNPSAD